MKIKIWAKALCLSLIICSVLSSLGIAVVAEDDIIQGEAVYEDDCAVLSENVRVGSRFFELFFGENKEDGEDLSLIPGGQVFGMKLKQKNLTVIDAEGIPALKNGDVILSINGKEVNSASQVKDMVKSSSGQSLTIRALHKGNEIAIEIKPKLVDGEYKLGISLRDGAAGLGTVTFYDPKTGTFGGLGHGVCDAESGEIIDMESGDVCGVVLGGINKGEVGKPGELRGILTDRDMGDLSVNSECGVFGTITDSSVFDGQTMEIGHRSEVTEGEATIISTLKNGKSSEYTIEIYDIDRDSTGSKSFRVRVTDETLKALTGGIVRGMSGSPIIQNGKLIGALTHVLVADPTEGYGIFIENMLSVAQMPMQKVA